MNLLNERIHNRMLGKKKRLDALRPLPSEIVRKMREQMRIEYTYNSNALEGNTLTLRETQIVIEEGITINGKSLRENVEAKNHPEAMAFVEELAKREIVEDDILRVHELIFKGIDESAGRYRIGQVRITGADFMPPSPQEIKPRILELLSWLHANPDELRPIELSAGFHHRLVHIHPFSDGNGRIARLLMNCILLKHGYPFVVVLKVDRKEYYHALREADHGTPSPFVNFVARCMERSLNLYLTAIGERQIITLEDASKSTNYSPEYLSLLARKGKIDAFKLGRKWVLTKEALKQYLQENSRKHAR